MKTVEPGESDTHMKRKTDIISPSTKRRMQVRFFFFENRGWGAHASSVHPSASCGRSSEKEIAKEQPLIPPPPPPTRSMACCSTKSRPKTSSNSAPNAWPWPLGTALGLTCANPPSPMPSRRKGSGFVVPLGTTCRLYKPSSTSVRNLG